VDFNTGRLKGKDDGRRSKEILTTIAAVKMER
jgi:hypothetical protein